MAKTALSAAAAVALFLLASSVAAQAPALAPALALAPADAPERMFVEGMVYCDPCRIEFPVEISTRLSGAKVSLQCICRQNRTVTYKVEGVTNMAGRYRLPVVGDHEEDICAVKLVSSPEKECSEKFKFIDSARVLLTENEGLVESTRYANPIGYMKATTDPRCAKILEDMGMSLATAQSKYLM